MNRRRVRHLLSLLVGVVGVMLVFSAPPASANDEARRVKAIAGVRPSVVSLRTHRRAGGEPGIGSGVIIRSDGLILTNHHVVEGAEVVKVYLSDERSFNGQILHMAPQHDLAILKIGATGLQTAPMGSSKNVKLGQTAIAIGDPLGFAGSVTLGTVGGLDRSVTIGNTTYRSLIQTDAAINPGSSGGALVDLGGKVIGINTLVYTGPRQWKHAQGLGFAISIDHAMMVTRALLQRTPESVSSRPWLGIKGDTVTRDLNSSYGLGVNRGVLVREVLPASPAANAGMRTGDVILRLDGEALIGLPELSDLLATRRAGDVVLFQVRRDGKMADLEVTLDVSSR